MSAHPELEKKTLLTAGTASRRGTRLSDKRVLKLIRAFLKAGVMEDGLVYPVDEGTPQGGPLSPTLWERSDNVGYGNLMIMGT